MTKQRYTAAERNAAMSAKKFTVVDTRTGEAHASGLSRADALAMLQPRGDDRMASVPWWLTVVSDHDFAEAVKRSA